MIIIDRALERRAVDGRPIRVGLVGAGALGKGVARQFITAATGQTLAVISNRHLATARSAWVEAGAPEPVTVDSVGDLESAIRAGRPAITDDPGVLCAAEASMP
jgi:predicted homoserine dehydrogenase-like protein